MQIFPDRYSITHASAPKASQPGQTLMDSRAALAAAEAAKPHVSSAQPQPLCRGLTRGENAYASSLKFPDNGPQGPRPAA